PPSRTRSTSSSRGVPREWWSWKAAATASAASVTEHGRVVVADPLPERRRAREPRVRHELPLVELARVEADRTDEQLAAAARELLEQPRERRAAVARDRLRLTGQA